MKRLATLVVLSAVAACGWWGHTGANGTGGSGWARRLADRGCRMSARCPMSPSPAPTPATSRRPAPAGFTQRPPSATTSNPARPREAAARASWIRRAGASRAESQTTSGGGLPRPGPRATSIMSLTRARGDGLHGGGAPPPWPRPRRPWRAPIHRPRRRRQSARTRATDRRSAGRPSTRRGHLGHRPRRHARTATSPGHRPTAPARTGGRPRHARRQRPWRARACRRGDSPGPRLHGAAPARAPGVVVRPTARRHGAGRRPRPTAPHAVVGRRRAAVCAATCSLALRNHATMKYWLGSAATVRFDNVGFDGPVVPGGASTARPTR